MLTHIKLNDVYTFKLSSGEELIAKVKIILGTHIVIENPVSVAPGPQGIGLVPSIFTADTEKEIRLNINSIVLVAETDEQVKTKYIQATTGITVPDKKLILG